MSVSIRRNVGESEVSAALPSPPPELARLQWESDRMRTLATRPNHRSVTYAEWAAFAVDMRERLAVHGIEASADAPAAEN